MAKMMSSAPIIDGSLYEDVSEYQKPSSVETGFYLNLVKQENRNHLLSTPDVSRAFPLSTPEVETLLSTCGGGSATTTSTSTSVLTPNSFLRPGERVTTEQDMYAQGFLQALEELRDHQSVAGGAGGQSTKTVTGSNLNCSTSGSVIQHPLISSTCNQFISAHQQEQQNNSLASMAPTYVNRSLAHFPVTQGESSSAGSSFIGAPAISSTAPLHDQQQSSFGGMPVASSYAAMFSTPSHHHPVAAPPPHHHQVLDGYGAFCIGHNNTTASTQGAIIHPQQHDQPPFTGQVIPEFIREMQSMVPADMATMEQLKVERKKARNRIAASKCRIRRLQRESELQGKVRILKQHNHELNEEVNKLKDEINNLKKALFRHQQKGCHIHVPPEFQKLLGSVTE